MFILYLWAYQLYFCMLDPFKFLAGSCQHVFLFKFPYKTINVTKGKISNSFIGKTTCVTGKAIKNYI